MTELIAPHGGELKNLLAPKEKTAEWKARLLDIQSWDLTARQMCDLELLMNGGFSPLTGFMGKKDYESVLEKMRLTNGTLWPIPITLDVTEEFAKSLKSGQQIALRSPEGVALAIITISDIWKPDRQKEAMEVYGTTDETHAGVSYVLQKTNPVYIGGEVAGLEEPSHHCYTDLRHTPAELRKILHKQGWHKIVAFQTRNPMHRAHYELTKQAAKTQEANLLLHPVVGLTKPGDIDYYTRVRCYKSILQYYPPQTTMLSLLQLAMRVAGPREALWHAIIRKNYGCTHFIVGRDHAGPGKDKEGKPFYGPYDAQELVRKHENELGIKLVPFKEMVYVEDKAQYMSRAEVPEGAKTLSISGTEFRRRLREGIPIPDWFSFPQIINELRKGHPERNKQGFTVFFTGLSGSGKSTIAQALMAKLMEIGTRPVTLLDGDIVRKNLSSELGFSKEHRDLNIRRIGFVASEITKNSGIALCAPIAPYDKTRQEVRELITSLGGFILVHVATPLAECEKRDRKGLYAKARQGIIKEFTGISDPYEEPKDAELVIDTTNISIEEAAQQVLAHLRKEGYI